MAEMTGTVVIVQEGRFHLIDDAGAGHIFVLSANAAAETEQLRALQKRQSRVRVTYSDSPNVVAFKARRVDLLGETSA